MPQVEQVELQCRGAIIVIVGSQNIGGLDLLEALEREMELGDAIDHVTDLALVRIDIVLKRNKAATPIFHVVALVTRLESFFLHLKWGALLELENCR